MVKFYVNRKTFVVFFLLIPLFWASCTKKEEVPIVTGTMADRDGNIYKTITIDGQTWMAENLRVTHYRNGDTVYNEPDNGVWSTLSTGAWCIYEDDYYKFVSYGNLYNWYALNDARKLAPTGWHIPSIAEWQALISRLGGSNLAGGKLKELGFSHWSSPNAGATDEIGFAARPGGYCAQSGSFFGVGDAAYFWTSTQEYSPTGFYCYMVFNTGSVATATINKRYGFAIRCVKDL